MAAQLRRLFKRMSIPILLCIGCAGAAIADGSAKDFVRQQAGKVALMADAEKIEFLASEVFRFQMLGVMRMTHVDWQFQEDAYLQDHQLTYGYKIRSSAEDIGYEAVQLEKSIARNKSADEAQRGAASDLMVRLKELASQSTELGVLYDEGDAEKAGHYFYSKIYPTFQSIRRGVATLNVELGKEVKLNALKFK